MNTVDSLKPVCDASASAGAVNLTTMVTMKLVTILPVGGRGSEFATTSIGSIPFAATTSGSIYWISTPRSSKSTKSSKLKLTAHLSL